jgi:hypothetical protein
MKSFLPRGHHEAGMKGLVNVAAGKSASSARH